MEVGLDPLEKIVKGHEILTWENRSGQALEDFCFHLYLNAFKNNRSTFVRENSFRSLWDSVEQAPDHFWGYTEVESIQVVANENGSRQQVISLDYIHPDDDNQEDRSVLMVHLDNPLPSGEEIQFRIDFESKLPRGARRTGWSEDYFLWPNGFPRSAYFRMVSGTATSITIQLNTSLTLECLTFP